jgi:hypothetical protein
MLVFFDATSIGDVFAGAPPKPEKIPKITRPRPRGFLYPTESPSSANRVQSTPRSVRIEAAGNASSGNHGNFPETAQTELPTMFQQPEKEVRSRNAKNARNWKNAKNAIEDSSLRSSRSYFSLPFRSTLCEAATFSPIASNRRNTAASARATASTPAATGRSPAKAPAERWAATCPRP